MSHFPQIVVGTYEEFVLGYKPSNSAEKNSPLKLNQTFATHSHQASVRCVVAHGRLMASSGADEYINIYDMIAREVSTVINYHNSTVTCLEFTPDGTHLVTANQSGDIAIFRCRDWTLVKLWKDAHKHANGVTSINIHPSGSLLVTTGADNILRFWNLVKGRQAYATNFSKKCSVGNSLNFGIWSKKGNFYAVCVGNKVEVYKTETATVVYEINTNSRAACATFTKKNLLCIGTEEGFLEIHSIPEKKLFLKQKVHETRIKSMAYFEVSINKNYKNKLENYLVSAESKGRIKLWYLKKKGLNYSLNLKGEVNCDCRITCLTMVASKDVKEEKDCLGTLNPTKEIENISENLNQKLDQVVETNSKKQKQKNLHKKELSLKLLTPQINGKSKWKAEDINNSKQPGGSVKSLKEKKRKISKTETKHQMTISSRSNAETPKSFKRMKFSNSLPSGKNKNRNSWGKKLVTLNNSK